MTKIDGEPLSMRHYGAWVIYDSEGQNEKGRIKDWNQKWVFVVYNCNGNWNDFHKYTAKATKPEKLTFTEEKG